MQKYKEIIASSWLLTKANKNLIIWYGFIPSLLTTLVGIIYFLYQIFATYNSKLFFEHENESFLAKIIKAIVLVIRDNPSLGIALIITSVVIFILYLLLPTIFQGGLIQLTARIINKQETSMTKGFGYGLVSFLPLFEYHLMIKSFGFFSILAEAAFVGRNLGWTALEFLSIPLILFAIIGFVFILLFTYTEYFIVIDNDPVFTSIRKSSRLVLTHWAETFLILILMLIISIRIFLNIILVLAVPALIIIPAGYLATVTFASIGYIIGGLIGVVALFFASYLGGILEVFATFVWVKTFLKFTTQEEVSAREAA